MLSEDKNLTNDSIYSIRNSIKLFTLIMVSKTLISIGIGVAMGLSPLRNSQLAKIIITITGG
jgi:hypothetical protein